MYPSLQVDCSCAARTYSYRTANCGAAARAVGMKPSTQLRVAERTSFRRAFEQDTHAIARGTWHNGRLTQTLTGKDVNSFTPWDTSSTVGGWSLFPRAVGPKFCEREQGRHCAGFAGIARATQARMPTDTLQYFGSIKLAANQTVSVKAMLKDDKAPEIRTATLLIPVSVHQSHAWCSLRVLVVALLSRGACACPTDT